MACRRVYFFLFFITISISTCYSQLTVSPNQTAAVLASNLVGTGVAILNPSLTCAGVANGTFTSTGTLLAMNSGIVLTNGHAAAIAGPEGSLVSFINGTGGDPSVAPLLPPGTATIDACYLEFDMIAAGDTVSFYYQFGSEEYRNAVCSIYTDVFAFFISGPGIVGTQNIALVPGTNLPVEINTVNNGTPGTVGGATLSNCTSIGAGSPFTAYYINNTGGPNLTYRGFTDKFRAFSHVTPCDTYHLKITIVDAGNAQYDSGVFLESSSLNTNSYHFDLKDSIGITYNGIPHTLIKGCSPTTIIKVVSSFTVATATTLSLNTGGTAVSGTDYVPLPITLTIPAGDTVVSFTVSAITTPPAGTKTLTLYLPSGCGAIDTLQLTIIDSPQASILTPDTTICKGSSVTINTTGSAGLTYNWSPIATLNSNTLATPIATPTATTTYTMTASLPGTACAAIVDSVTISVDTNSVFLITPDTSICTGQSVTIQVQGGNSFSYSWSPATGLDSTTIKDPIATPTVTTTYYLTTTPLEGTGCASTQQVTISIVNATLHINTPDTAICRGNVVQVIATGPTIGATYQWIPTAGIHFSTIIDPLIAPDTSATYVLYATLPGCTGLSDSFHIDVQPNPTLFVGNDRYVCQFDTLHLQGLVTPGNYPHYSYSWTPTAVLDSIHTDNVIFSSPTTTTVYLTVSTSAGCNAVDSVLITVRPNNFVSIINDTTICPRDSVQLITNGGAYYHWYPNLFLTDTLSGAPWAHPVVTQSYTVVAMSQYGCLDTVSINITVEPAAILYMPDSVVLHPGETYLITTQSNCVNFSWFPPSGLSNAQVSNPTANPDYTTRYYVDASTEFGCKTRDSIDVIIDLQTLLAIPNAFTPGNGPNSILYIIKRGDATLNFFRIFNRWGNKVFDTNNIDAGWDGNYQGVPQPYDVYVYEAEAVTNTGVVFHKKGNITLMR